MSLTDSMLRLVDIRCRDAIAPNIGCPLFYFSFFKFGALNLFVYFCRDVMCVSRIWLVMKENQAPFRLITYLI